MQTDWQFSALSVGLAKWFTCSAQGSVLGRSQDTFEPIHNTSFWDAKREAPLKLGLADDTLDERDTLIMEGDMLPQKNPQKRNEVARKVDLLPTTKMIMLCPRLLQGWYRASCPHDLLYLNTVAYTVLSSPLTIRILRPATHFKSSASCNTQAYRH
jgi:hypothetical protein